MTWSNYASFRSCWLILVSITLIFNYARMTLVPFVSFPPWTFWHLLCTCAFESNHTSCSFRPRELCWLRHRLFSPFVVLAYHHQHLPRLIRECLHPATPPLSLRRVATHANHQSVRLSNFQGMIACWQKLEMTRHHLHSHPLENLFPWWFRSIAAWPCMMIRNQRACYLVQSIRRFRCYQTCKMTRANSSYLAWAVLLSRWQCVLPYFQSLAQPAY